MNKSTEIRRGRHCVFILHVHLVFITKYRRRVFTHEILSEMEKIFQKVCLDFECDLKEFNGEKDHVHLLVNFPPKVSLSKLVNSFKGVSARILRKRKYPSVQKYLYGRHLWSPSYFASTCGGAPLMVLKNYIENQKSPN